MRVNARSPLLAAAACLLAFGLVLGCAYAIPPASRFDAIALNGLTTLDGPYFGPVAQLAAHSADPLPLVAMLVVLFACGWSMGRRWEAFAAVALVVSANVATQALKVALAHPRVQPSLGADQLGPEAFPSGHATSSTLAAMSNTPTNHFATDRFRITSPKLSAAGSVPLAPA